MPQVQPIDTMLFFENLKNNICEEKMEIVEAMAFQILL